MISFLRFFYLPSFVVRSAISGRYFMATLCGFMLLPLFVSAVTLNTLGTDVWVTDIRDYNKDGYGHGLIAQNASVVQSFVGLIELTGGDNQVRRTVWTFDLPELALGQEVIGATLSYHVGITNPGDTVRVYHSQTHNQSAFFVSLFEDTSYSSQVDSFDFDSGISNSVRNVNVLTEIQGDYENDGGNTFASFRFQVDSGATGDVRIGGFANTSQIPTLTLQFRTIPEPASAASFAALLLLVWRVWSRRFPVL